MAVTIRQLRAFVSVAQERSFARAAARLRVTPSAVTIAIRELEAEVGLRLFDRSTRAVDLTAQASAFLPVLERVLDDLDHALDDLRSLAEGKKGSVVVASSAGFINYVLAPSVAEMAATHPGVSVRTIEDTTDSVIRRVVTAEADFGITTLWRPIDKIRAVPLLRDRFGLLLPRDHPLGCQDGPLDWSAIGAAPLVALAPEAGIRTQLDAQPRLKQVLRQPLYDVSSLAALQALVARGAAVAVVPWMATRLSDGSTMTFRPLQGPTIWRELFMILNAQRAMPPAAADLIDRVVSELRRLHPSEHIRIDLHLDRLRPAASQAWRDAVG